MPLIIPNRLRALVETYLKASDRAKEAGGYFFGTTEVLHGFLPIPNYSETPTRSYSRNNTVSIANSYARMLGYGVVADMHTHPSGSVPSEVDGKYVQSIDWPYHIVIADKQEAFEWFVLDKSLRTVPWASSDVELEAYAEALAGEVGLNYLGQVFITPGGEIVGKPEAKKLLNVNQDVYRLENWLRTRSFYAQSSWKYAEASRELGISVARVKKAYEKHKKEAREG
ncbi:MAG: Mov34/MPN/PAD-1 family protein [Methanoregulaceae archaeon]|nr:Mov34/MPN/PAD-1 family protein [Methanoregulaceae archaeon]